MNYGLSIVCKFMYQLAMGSSIVRNFTFKVARPGGIRERPGASRERPGASGSTPETSREHPGAS